MTFYLNPDDVMGPIFTILNTDGILKGSQYLNAANRIYKYRAPNVKTNHIVIQIGELIPNDMQQYSAELRVHVYTMLLADGQIDAVGNRILSRCDELLNNVSPTISGGTMQPLNSLGIISSFYDQGADQSKAHGVCRYRLEIGK